MDVFQSDCAIDINLSKNIVLMFEQLSKKLNDYPIDFYQNIIDPNLLLDKNDNWIATNQKIEEYE